MKRVKYYLHIIIVVVLLKMFIVEKCLKKEFVPVSAFSRDIYDVTRWTL